MANNLVIVESPAKAGTIQKYLGDDFQVLASMGHVRDLPSSKLGVDVENNFAPQYVIPIKARPNIKKLKAALKGKKVVYLATDLDREGEAIAWHVAQALELDKDKDLKVFRITFDEITKAAVTRAIESPRDINYQLVDAQQARRVLDRLVGYTLSPVLWKKLYKGLSAGRVQSVALRLIVEREAERDAFQPVEYWSIEAELLGKVPPPFTAKLVQFQGKKIEQLTVTTKQAADDIYATLTDAVYKVTAIDKKNVKRKPQAPYTTATFQQDAVNRLGMSAKQAMRNAQKLYEAGHITYMRTDSVDLAAEAVTALRMFIENAFGKEYVPATQPKYVTKTKQAQEAHEAIRPTNPVKKGDDVTSDEGERKVYDLIRARTLASQMAEAVLAQTSITINAAEAEFRTTGQVVVFAGYQAALPQKENADEQQLPVLEVGEVVSLQKLTSDQHFTEPPPRYSEATLIKALEEYGIGRPSTYAPTMDTLSARKYVLVEQRRFIPESIGIEVTKLLTEHFPQIVDLGFTADMENKLDDIAGGTSEYQKTLQEFWDPFHKQVEEKTEKIAKVDMTEATDEVCPTCGKPMVIKQGRFGKFLACTGFPDCKTTKPIVSTQPTGLICPKDGKELIWKKARRGNFIGCSGYPNCDFALWKRELLLKKIEELEAAGTELPHKEEALAAFATPQPVSE